LVMKEKVPTITKRRFFAVMCLTLLHIHAIITLLIQYNMLLLKS